MSNDRPVERKYSIFISSTFEDLKERRRDAIISILKTGNIPLSMEISFFPGEKRDADFFASNINKCDIFIIVLHTFFGSRMEGDNRSYTEYEYDTAKNKEKPIIAFVPNLEFLEKNVCEKDQLSFIEKVKSGTLLVHMYSSVEEINVELPNLINKAVIGLINAQTGGWVRSEHYDKLRKFANLPDAMIGNELTLGIYKTLSSTEKFYSRINLDEVEKKSMAKYAVRLLMAGIISKFKNLYIDGSTTTLWLCAELVAYFDRFDFDSADSMLRIYTNGIFDFVYLTTAKIRAGIDSIQMHPSRPSFSDDYGVVWGPSKSGPPGNTYEYDHKDFKYSKDVLNRVHRYKEEFTNEMGEATILASSFTGYDYSEESCGPFVRSFNTLIEKRALYSSGKPLILLFDGKKWISDADKRFPIFRPEEWRKLLLDCPILIASVTFIKDKQDEIIRHFEGFGMKHEKEEVPDMGSKNIYLALHFNKKFANALGVFEAKFIENTEK